MKRYLVGLSVLSAVMLLLAFAVKWLAIPLFVPVPMWMLPAAVIYFAVAYGVQYWLSVSSVNKHPKAFIQFFLATTVAVSLYPVLLGNYGGGVVLAHRGAGRRYVGKSCRRQAFCHSFPDTLRSLYGLYDCGPCAVYEEPARQLR